MRRIFFIMALAVYTVVLTGCGMKQQQTVDYHVIDVPDGKDSKPIAFRRMVVKVARGSTIGSIRMGWACVNYGDLKWKSGRKEISDDEFTGIFFDELKKGNYNILGDPNNLFEDDTKNAEIMVSGLITNISWDVCYPAAGFGDYSGGTSNGSVVVEWQVYDTLDKKIIYKTTVTGSGSSKFSRGDEKEGIYMAFTNAVQGLLADAKFHQLVMQKDSSGPTGPLTDAALLSTSGSASGAGKGKTSGSVSGISKGKEQGSVADAQKSVVVIQSGAAWGSGFLVGNEGYILTNHHVVEGKKTVRIVYSDGTKAEGQVLRTDPRQDVGLVQVSSPPVKALTVRAEELPVGTDVYAIGAPYEMSLQGTVSKGVVSSYRQNKRGRWLQSDTTVNHGNSGGPLVDVHGRVVGMCSWGYAEGQNVTSGLNFFVPIAEALTVMNLASN